MLKRPFLAERSTGTVRLVHVKAEEVPARAANAVVWNDALMIALD